MPMYWSGGWGGWLLMTFAMMVLWGAVVWAIVYAVRGFRDRRERERRSESSALEILEGRYARGEIDDKEFRERRKALTEGRAA